MEEDCGEVQGNNH